MGGDDKTIAACVSLVTQTDGFDLLVKHRGDFADRDTGGKCTANSSAGPKI